MRRVALAAGFALVAAACSDAPEEPLDLHGSTMGTSWHVRVVDDAQDELGLRAGIQGVLDGVDRAMSTWKTDSDISRFNAASEDLGTWFPVSRDTVLVVQRAIDWSDRSGGAFDVTVGPLVQLWGFGAATISGPPTPEAIQAALANVGSAALGVRLDPPALRRDAPGRRLDLSAIAKGHAVDLVVDWLRGQGVEAAMVEVGGEVRCYGSRPDGSAWRIGLEEPLPTHRVVGRTLELQDRALASSGDYRNFRELDGRRVSHTIDPRSGRPVEHSLAAVSVSDESCADADALCTALMVMGSEEGYSWAVDRSIAARFVVRTDGGFETRSTPRFRDLHGEE